MSKIKGQRYDFKQGVVDAQKRRPNLAQAMHGESVEWRERLWASILAYTADGEDEIFSPILRNVVVPEMQRAAKRGDHAAFQRLASCVEMNSQLRAGAKAGWADPLAAKMVNWAGGAHFGEFNVEQFIRETGSNEDPKTIRARVRAFGFKAARRGAPRKK